MIERQSGLWRHAIASVAAALALVACDAIAAAQSEPVRMDAHLDAGYGGSPPSLGAAGTLTRRDAAAMVARLAGLDTAPPLSNTFHDVPRSDARFGAIEAMWREGVTAGCSASHGVRSYCPDRPITRGQLAVFLSRAFALDPPTSGQHFSDVASAHPFYAFIEGLAQAGLAEPCPGQPGNFCPDAPATRSDAATMLSRFLLAGIKRPTRGAEVAVAARR